MGYSGTFEMNFELELIDTDSGRGGFCVCYS